MIKITQSLTLAALLVASSISSLAQAADKPLLQAGKQTLFQRVLTTPGCELSAKAGQAAG